MPDNEEDASLGLDEVLDALRRDLLSAQSEASGENYGLSVDEVEIELSVEVKKQRSAKGELGAKWFVLSGSGSAEGSSARTSANKITIKLTPKAPGAGESTAPVADSAGTSQREATARPRPPASSLEDSAIAD